MKNLDKISLEFSPLTGRIYLIEVNKRGSIVQKRAIDNEFENVLIFRQKCLAATMKWMSEEEDENQTESQQ